MAKKKEAKKKELKVVNEEVINGAKIVTYEDGSVDIFPAPIHFTAEQASDLFSDEDDDEDEEEEDDEPLTAEALAAMDFEELEDVCDDKDLDTDPDDYEEEDIEKLRKEIAKELGLKLPKSAGKGKGKKKK